MLTFKCRGKDRKKCGKTGKNTDVSKQHKADPSSYEADGRELAKLRTHLEFLRSFQSCRERLKQAIFGTVR